MFVKATYLKIVYGKFKCVTYLCAIIQSINKVLLMKKQLLQILSIVAILFINATFVLGQGTVKGQLVDSETNEGLIAASITINGTSTGTITDGEGNFLLSGIPVGNQILVFTYVGYSDVKKEVSIKDGETIDLGAVQLSTGAIGVAEVQILASIAVDRKTPVAVSTLDGIAIEEKLGNQEFPEILKATPSVFATKQGGGFGDARINIRGFSQENIALLINGISVSGMEDNKVYWSNWSGLGDVTRTMQVQRGLGATKMATSSVGGTINIITKTTDQEKGGSISRSIGNNGYEKTAATLSTGRTDNGWAFTVSGSRTTGDGYIEGNYIDAWSYFASVAKEIGKDQQLLFTIFGAPQRHGQRSFWQPIDEQRDVYGAKWSDDFGYYNGGEFTFRENFYHKPQASLNHIWDINSKTNLITAVYGSVGRGGGTGDIGQQREYLLQKDNKGNQAFDLIANRNSGLSNDLNFAWGQPTDDIPNYNYVPQGSSDTLSDARIISNEGGGIIKRASMNEHQWYGVLSTLTTELSSNLTLSGGADLRFYTGSHYRKTIDLIGGDYWFDNDDSNNQNDWVDFDGDGMVGAREMGNLVRPTNDASSLFGAVSDDQKIDYYNDEDINWYGLFAQLEYSEGPLSAFFSGAYNYTQMRRYDFFNKAPGDQVTDWINFSGGNVKAGANYNVDDNNNVFLNAGYISRAPYFDALFPTYNNDEPNLNAANENVAAVEVGYGYRSSAITANVNAYYTKWTNKTETLQERENGIVYFSNLLGVDATHMGVEFDVNAKVGKRVTLTAYGSFQDNKWDKQATGTVVDENQNVVSTDTFHIEGLRVGDAAQTSYGFGAEFNLGAGLSLDFQVLHYERLYAKLTPSDRDDLTLPISGKQPLILPSYTLADAGLVWRFKFAGLDAKANVNVNNLFDTFYISDAQDRYRENTSSAQLANDTLGWIGFGRTWNAGVKLYF
jgi:hypothetical protein